MKKVFLEELPRWESGKNKGNINWSESIGQIIKFIYNDIEGWVKIVDFKTNNRHIYLKYLNNEPVEIFTSLFLKGALGKVLGKVTNEFKIKIGQILKDNKRDITIIDREYKSVSRESGIVQNLKYYKYKCNKCGYEGYTDEYNLIKGDGCGCCKGFVVIEGINDIPTTAPWMVKYFQGGYDEAKFYTRTSNKKIIPICPDCGRIKDRSISIGNIFIYKSICCQFCRDGKPYPEKFMFSLLEKLCVDFKIELSNTNFDWCDKYRYDFYFEFNNERYIIETHGLQHYKDCNNSKAEDVQENDRIKKELALKNGIKENNYIVIDCRKSDMDFIKDNILKSEINEIFNLNNIDWNKCEEFSLSNLVKKVCEIKRSNTDITTREIGEVMKLDRTTIINYLKKGTKLGWCNYDPKEEQSKTSGKNGKFNRKPVKVFKDNVLFGIFKSVTELERQSEIIFGKKLDRNKISAMCNNKLPQYKGFTFKYVDKSNEYKTNKESA